MGQKGADTSCLARIGTLGFIVLRRSSQDFTHYCTLRSEAREKAQLQGLQQPSQVVHRSQRMRMLFTKFGPASGSYLVSCVLHRFEA